MTPLRRLRPQTGSLLIEVAASVAVLGLLTATSFGVLRDVDQDRQGRAALAMVERAKQATLEFALAHGRLPCPDLSGDGGEGDAGGVCPSGSSYGLLPARTLGLEMAPMQATLALRYGVFRATPDADLSSSASPPSMDPSVRFLTRAEHAATPGAGTGQPYVPQSDALGQATDCGTVGQNPAFVISVGEHAEVGNATCFPIPPRNRGALASMGRHELVGWIRSKFRTAN